MKPPKPKDWDKFVDVFKKHGDFRPRSYEYEKAPRWLWHREYRSWKAGGKKFSSWVLNRSAEECGYVTDKQAYDFEKRSMEAFKKDKRKVG
jgi:hypothetical protein